VTREQHRTVWLAMTECMNDKCPAIQDVIGKRYDGTRIAQGINEASGHDVAAVTASTAKKNRWSIQSMKINRPRTRRR